MKTKICIIALLALPPSFRPCPLEETFPGGIVHGPKAGFNISAPEGWVVDNESGKGQDMPVRSLPERFVVVRREDGDVRESSQPPGKA